jgi:DNA-binding response OmpR family regulator
MYSELIKEKFLVVDKDSVFISLFEEVVNSYFNASTIKASNCDDILKIAEREKPCLIVLDLFLHSHICTNSFLEWIKKGVFDETVLDVEMAYSLGEGLKIASVLKSAKATKSIPILAMSTLDYDFVRTAVKLVECDGYLAKPFTINDLVAGINNLRQSTKTNRWVRGKK